MRVGKVAGNEYLVRFHFAQQVAYDFYVSFRQRTFLDAACFVEGQVEEVAVIQRYIVVSTCRACFTAANQTFDGQDIARINIAVFFLFQELADFCIFINDHLIFAVIENLVETIDEMHEADYFFITYGNVAGSFVSYVHIMFLLYQAADGATHRNHVVVRMRREYNDPFRIRLRTFGTISVVSVWLSTGPAGDGVLQVVEYLDIHIVCRTE